MGGYLDNIGNRLFFQDQGVVPCGSKCLGDILHDDAVGVLVHDGGLTVHQIFGTDNLSPEDLADRLVAKADTENRDRILEMADYFKTDPGIIRCGRSR